MNFDKIDSRSADRRPLQFACRFLKHRGAALEKTETGYYAALTGELIEQLGLPDLVCLQDEPSASAGPGRADDGNAAPGDPVCAVHYGAPLLDRMIDLACREIPMVTYRLHFDYIKSQGFQKLIREQFSFPNAVGRVESQAVTRTEYLLIICRYVVQSDEQKEGLIPVVFNVETGACIPGMAGELPFMNRTLDTGGPAGGYQTARVEKIFQQAATTLKRAIAEETVDFQESMNRRFRRDVNNLNAYYGSLKEEMEKSLDRPGLSPQLIRDRREKIDLIPDELERKKDDLLKKYSIKIKVAPCTLMRIKTEAVKLLLDTAVGKATRTLPLIYNPVTKAMDPQVCQGCGAHTYRCTFCSSLHLLCESCRNECPKCASKPG